MTDVPTFAIDEIIGRFGGRDRFQPYLDLLKDFNERVNLVSRETTDSNLWRMIAECLAPFCVSRAKLSGMNFKSVLDIGSGGGFPGIPILLAGLAESGELFERRSNKATSLAAIARLLGIQAQINQIDFSEIDRAAKYSNALITLRWVKPDPRLLKNINRVLEPGSVFLYYSEPTPDFEFFKGIWSVSTFEFRLTEQSGALRTATVITVNR